MYNKAELKDYYKKTKKIVSIPEISSGFIPQGIAIDENSEKLLLTGYFGDGDASPLFVIDMSDGSSKKIHMTFGNGKEFKGHAGGLSVYGDKLYIAGSTQYCMFYYNLVDIIEAEDGSCLPFSGRVDLKNDDDYLRVSFTAVDNNLLYAGEFHKSPLFYTHRSHKITYEGTVQKGYLFGFKVDDSNMVLPECVFSISDKAQGACFYGDNLYISRSNGFLPSQIMTFSLKDIKTSQKQRILGMDVPLYVASEALAKKITLIPPMSEEIYAYEDQMYIVYEAAANRYRIGKKNGQDSIHAIPIDYFG